MSQVIKVNVVSVQAYLGFVDSDEQTDRHLPQAPLKSAVNQQQVGSAEAVIRITGQHGLTIQIRAADRRLRKERNNVPLNWQLIPE